MQLTMAPAGLAEPGQNRALLKSLLLHLLILLAVLLAPSLRLPSEHSAAVIQAYVMPQRAVHPLASHPVSRPAPPPADELTPPPPPTRKKLPPKPAPVKPRPVLTLPQAPVKHRVAAAPPAPPVVKTPPHKVEKVAPKPLPKPPVAPPKAPPPKPQPKAVAKPKPPVISQQDIDSEEADIESQADQAKAAQHQADLEAMQQEAAASLKAVTQRANRQIVKEYTDKIKQQISGKWHRPMSAQAGMTVLVHIHLQPGGDVDHVEVIKSSGDAAYDNSVVQAVYDAAPLQVPEDADVFNDNFRSFNLRVNPEDMTP